MAAIGGAFMLKRLAEMVRRKEVILWVGAGFNARAGLPSGEQLKERILAHCTPEERAALDRYGMLPDVAEEFAQMRSRNELLRIIKQELALENPDYRVHDYVRDIPQIDTIVTTNYDRLFEDRFGSGMQAISTDNDLAFAHGGPSRPRLYKIHGDINDPASIIVTRSDYRRLDTRDSLMWASVKAAVAERSVVFIGYSFTDPDAHQMFEEIMARLGKLQRESFVIIPSVPDHKRHFLSRYDLRPVLATAEDALKQIHNEVIKHLLKDCVAGLVDPAQANPTLKSRNAEVTWEIGPAGKRIVRVRSTAGEEGGGRIHLTVSNALAASLQQFLIDGDGDVFEIPSEHLVEFESSIGGVLLPAEPEGQSTIRLERQPTKEFTGVIFLEGAESSPVEVSVKSYVSQESVRLTLEHRAFRLDLRFYPSLEKDARCDVTLRPLPDAFQGTAVVRCLLGWLDGKRSYLTNPTDNVVGRLPALASSHDRTHDMRLTLQTLAQIYEAVVALSTHFKVYFSLPEEMSEGDLSTLFKVHAIIQGVKTRVNNVTGVVTVAEGAKVDDVIGGEPAPLRLEQEDPCKVVLFGQELTLGIPVYEATDAYIANEGEVREAFMRGEREIPVVFKSASNELLIAFQPVPESQQHGDR